MGAGCDMRADPEHVRVYAHPGEADFRRQTCPEGASCSRRGNAEHCAAFYHRGRGRTRVHF